MSNSARAVAASGTIIPNQKVRQKDVGTLCADCPARSRKPRSYQQHKRYFAMLKAVHFHWPESYPRQFANETALRKWAQMKAGHYSTKAIDLYGIPPSKAQPIVQATLEAAAPYSEAVIQGRSLVIFSPLSINYDTLGHAEFCDLNDDVASVIRQETGLDPEKVLRETKRAA